MHNFCEREYGLLSVFGVFCFSPNRVPLLQNDNLKTIIYASCLSLPPQKKIYLKLSNPL